MAEKQKSAWCPVCDQQRLFTAPKPSHALHLILTIIIVGLWLIDRPLIGGKTGPYRCTVCGTKEGARPVPGAPARPDSA